MKNIHFNFILIKKKIQDIIKNNSLALKKIKIVAVSKNQNINVIKEAISLGVDNFGENYIQESIIKIKKLKKYKNVTWHFIGKIQSNKTKKISENFSWCQTVDRKKIAFLLNQARPINLPPLNILIQINISKELNKNGVDINQYEELAQVVSLMPNLNFRGIMVMPSIKKNIIENNFQYEKAKTIFNKLRKKYISVDTLSLGTSIDIKKALLATSNMLRIGRDIFNK